MISFSIKCHIWIRVDAALECAGENRLHAQPPTLSPQSERFEQQNLILLKCHFRHLKFLIELSLNI